MKAEYWCELFWWIWIVMWFAAIWLPQFRMQLFLSGLFCFVIGLIYSVSLEDKKKGKE